MEPIKGIRLYFLPTKLTDSTIVTQKRLYSISDVRRTYSSAKAREEWFGDWASALLYRPLSFVVTPLFIALGFSAKGVTLLSLCIAVSLPLLAAFGGWEGVFWVAGLATLWVILDCVDGNVARLLKSASSSGQYLDFVTDVGFRASLYAAIGLLADSLPGSDGNALAYTILAAYIAIAARFCRLFCEQMSGADIYREPTCDDNDVKPRNITQIVFSFLSGVDRLLPLMVLIGALLQQMDWIVIFLMVYSTLDFSYTQLSIARRLSAKTS